MDIKAIREQKHLTQEELAEQSGLSVRTIQRIEAGQEPKGHTAKVLADILDLDVSSLSKSNKTTDSINYSLVKSEQNHISKTKQTFLYNLFYL